MVEKRVRTEKMLIELSFSKREMARYRQQADRLGLAFEELIQLSVAHYVTRDQKPERDGRPEGAC